MSHAMALVVVPPHTEWRNIRSLVSAAMAPHSEDVSDDGWWDWWQIGGRYTGTIDGYDPTADLDNIEFCGLCHGSGIRSDFVTTGGCNGCEGRGVHQKWPSKWAEHEGDLAWVQDLIDSGTKTFTLVKPDGYAIHREVWDGSDWVTDLDFDDHVQSELENLRAYMVAVVDYHS